MDKFRSPYFRSMIRVIALVGLVLGANAGSTNNTLITISESYLRSLLLPDDDSGNKDSLVTYLIDIYSDRSASEFGFNDNDATNLFAMFQKSEDDLAGVISEVRDKFFQGYVDPEYSDDQYFSYQVNRALMAASQSLLANYSADATYSVSSSSTDFLKLVPASAQESIDYLVDSTPTTSDERSNKDIVVQYGLQEKVKGTDYEIISDFLNGIDYSLFTLVQCSSSFLENTCLPCKQQTGTAPYTPYSYKDTTNSSCTMRKEYIDKPWNGMKSLITSLHKVDKVLKSTDFQKKLPTSIVDSSMFTAYKNGASCLIGDLKALYLKKGNWYEFYHWSNFTDNSDCKELLLSAGRSAEQSADDSIGSFLYSYFLGSSSVRTSKQSLSMDAINVVNIIDGYVMNGSPSARLTSDPTNPLLQALTAILYRLREQMQAQVSRAVTDVTSNTSALGGTSKTLLSDNVFLLSYYMSDYASKQYDSGNICRYQGLSDILTQSSSTVSDNYFSMQKKVILDVVGQSSLTSPIVGFKNPLPDLQTLTLDKTDISPSKQAQFLKYGRYALSARYKKSTDSSVYEGVLSAPDSGETSATFSVSRMVSLIQENQAEVKKQLDAQLKKYNQNMNLLIMKRMMIAYMYEYISVSKKSSWQDLQSSGQQICPLSASRQLQISSTWRTDPKNESLASLLKVTSDLSSSTGSSGTENASSSQSGSVSSDMKSIIQYNQSMTYWDSIEVMRDEVFQMAKNNYLMYLEYKMRELILVFQAALVAQNMQTSKQVQQGFPSTINTYENNQKSYLLVNTVASASGTDSSGVSTEDGTVDTDVVKSNAGVPSSAITDMVNDTAAQGCCKTE